MFLHFVNRIDKRRRSVIVELDSPWLDVPTSELEEAVCSEWGYGWELV